MSPLVVQSANRHSPKPGKELEDVWSYVSRTHDLRVDRSSRVAGTGLKCADVAEPIPSPATEYFGHLARKHDLYIVAGLYERAGHLIHNAAVLPGPDGKTRAPKP